MYIERKKGETQEALSWEMIQPGQNSAIISSKVCPHMRTRDHSNEGVTSTKRGLGGAP